MIENRNKPETANFFWEGPISNYEIASINSFVKSGFSVNLWTYNQELFSEINTEVNIIDASNILKKDTLYQLNQNYQKANYSSFSNLFRYKLLETYGGWWFDSDCFCHKEVDEFVNLTKDREYVLGLEKENYVGSAVMYFNDLSLLKKIQERAYSVIENKNYRLRWGEIGPDLITETVISEGLINTIFPPDYFFPISPTNIQALFNSKISIDDKDKINQSFTCHTWNEMFRKYNINKNIHPPKSSYMYHQFLDNGIVINNEVKIYSQKVIVRFMPFVSIIFKLYSRIRVTIKNYKTT
tara:strand:- start:532 stop:1422 length:891 start_codon:yes stop_codon:yes gene_type:complete